MKPNNQSSITEPMSVKKTFTVSETALKMLGELRRAGGFLTDSETVRYAINVAHKQKFPYYKVVGEAKDEEFQARKELRKLPVEQYVAEVLQGDIKSKPGFCHLIHKNNPLFVVDIPINLVKNYGSRNEVWESVDIAPENE